MQTTDFLAKLKGVKKTPQGWAAQCPAHEDKRQSLSVKEGEKGIVCKCHAGCAVKDIAAGAGLKLADLFYDGKTTPKPKAQPAKNNSGTNAPLGKAAQPGASRIVAEYDYRDEKGTLLFQVVRFDPKDFRQRAPDQNARGGWNWKTADVRKVLWRLPQLIEAAKDDAETPLFVCEGEKDVLAFERNHCLATCNPGGAGKWLAGYTGALAAFRRIIIVADKDEPGRKHARDVANALSRSNRVVNIIEVPGDKHKDAADFFAAGGSAVELMELADKSPKIQPVQTTAVPVATDGTELPECVYDLNRQKFFVPMGAAGADRNREWIPLSDTRINVHFKSRGYSEFIKDSLGVTKLESALQRVLMEKNVTYAGPLAGYWPGPVDVDGRRCLVTSGPKLLDPQKGEWEKFRALTEKMFWDETHQTLQWELFCGWLRAAIIALRDGTFQPGLALVLCGKSDNGKSFLQKLITLILGGRFGNPYDWMTEKTNFNDDFIGAEHLTIDDEASSKDNKSRTALGQRIKQIVVGGSVRFDGKFVKSLTVRPFFRLSICLNDDAQDLMVLPPMEESIKNKFLILHLKAGTFPSDPNDFEKFRRSIIGELPAFVHWLLTEFKLPAKWHSPRFGVLNWQHPDLIFEMEDLHPWKRLLELVDHVKPWGCKTDRFEFIAGADGECWEGTGQDLEEVLRAQAGSRAQSVLRGPQATGMDLKSAERRLPGRIGWRKSNGHKIWIIKKPASDQ